VAVNSPIFVGGTAVITVVMDPEITATVQVKVNGTIYDVAVVNGRGSLNVTGLLNYTHIVNVTFAGDTRYAAANNTTQLKVNKVVDYVINVTAVNITVGKNETITVILPADVNSTNLIVKVNGSEKAFTMVNGIATVIVPGLAVGTYEVNVTYKGDDKYFIKYNNGTRFKVTGTDSYNITLDVESHTYGEYTIFNVTVPNDVVNNVTIKVDSVSYSVKVNNTTGVATLRLNNLSGGLHAVTATYPADDKYLSISNSTTFTVDRASTNITVEFTNVKLVGDSIEITIRLNRSVNGTVTLHVDNNN
jgi:hypothetical protein